MPKTPMSEIYKAYSSILADLARDLLCLYADDHDTILLEFALEDTKEFDAEVERIAKRIDYLESQLLQLGDTYEIDRTMLP